MQISQIIGGFSLAQGDMLRRAMGKKKADVMAAFKIDFVEGAVKQNYDKKLSIEIFDLLEKFAKYGFNKSHSTAYALIAYQTAWLKTHYPAEFLAANLSSEMDNTDRVVALLESTRNMNIEILPPDVNTSFAEFHAINDNLSCAFLDYIMPIFHNPLNPITFIVLFAIIIISFFNSHISNNKWGQEHPGSII